MSKDYEVNHPVLKIFSAILASLAGMSWGEIASMLAAGYTVLLIVDWFWKRIFKPVCVRKGWIKGSNKEFMTSTHAGELHD